MSVALHIPMEELSLDTRALLERAKEGSDIFIDGNSEGYRISRFPGRTLSEILSDPKIIWSDAKPDEYWGKDLQEIIALRKQEISDPWAE